MVMMKTLLAAAHEGPILDAKYNMPALPEMVPAHLTLDQQRELYTLLEDRAAVFQGRVGKLEQELFIIPMMPDAKPYATCPYPIPTKYLDATKTEIFRLVEVGVWRRTGNPPGHHQRL
ncbi:hypothetical protein AaE_007886 [Aphanomyces astaci]|uniref:Uncharacterized protein n=1 Tax=Aphanomyces astaci TaxID=112090 RepID=A0A6A5ACD4_APHAT|nr:hypothetical protein AaE_007886 [Aphanomyces astaci]